MEPLPNEPLLPQPSPQEITSDGNALREEEAIQKGYNLEDQEKLNARRALERTDKLDGHVHNIIVFGTYSVSGIIFLVFCWLVWNEAAPNQLRYLSPDEIANLYKFLLSGGIGAGIKAMFARLGKK